MTTPTRRRIGRPTDPDLTRRLLDAAAQLLAEYGSERCTIDAVAELAGAGKAGLYRRWPSREDFLAAVLADALAAPVTYPEPRTPAGDLAALLAARVTGRAGSVSAALLSLIGPVESIREAWNHARRQTFAAVVDLAATHRLPISGGELAHAVEQLAAWHLVDALAHAGRRPDAETIARDVADVLAPLAELATA